MSVFKSHAVRIHPIIIIIFVIMIMTTSSFSSGKNKTVYKMLSQLHKHLGGRKLKKNSANQRLTAPWNPSNVPVSNMVKGMAFHMWVWEGRKHLANWDNLHLDTSNSNRWAAAADGECQTLTKADGISLNTQLFEFELILYNIHSPSTWRRRHTNKKI